MSTKPEAKTGAMDPFAEDQIMKAVRREAACARALKEARQELRTQLRELVREVLDRPGSKS